MQVDQRKVFDTWPKSIVGLVQVLCINRCGWSGINDAVSDHFFLCNHRQLGDGYLRTVNVTTLYA